MTLTEEKFKKLKNGFFTAAMNKSLPGKDRLWALKKLKLLVDRREKMKMVNTGEVFDEEGLDVTECEEMILKQCKQKEEEEKKEKQEKNQEQEKNEENEEDQQQLPEVSEVEPQEEIKINLPLEVLMAIEATGLDRKEQEIKVKTAVISSPCLIMDYTTGRYKRVSLNETDGPPEN